MASVRLLVCFTMIVVFHTTELVDKSAHKVNNNKPRLVTVTGRCVEAVMYMIHALLFSRRS